MDLKERKARAKGQSPEDNKLRGGLSAGLLGGIYGVAPGIHNASDYQKAGKVYRKRDGFRDGITATGGAVVGAAGGALVASRLVKNSHLGAGIATGALAGALGGGYVAGRLTGKAALRRRQAADKDGKQFMAKNTSSLVELNARLDSKLKQVGFAVRPQNDDETNSGLKTAAGVAGVGALAAGGLYARGRFGASGGGSLLGAPVGGVRGVLDTMKGGANLLKGDVGSTAAKVGNLAVQGGKKANAVGRSMVASSLLAARKVKAKLPFGK